MGGPVPRIVTFETCAPRAGLASQVIAGRRESDATVTSPGTGFAARAPVNEATAPRQPSCPGAVVVGDGKRRWRSPLALDQKVTERPSVKLDVGAPPGSTSRNHAWKFQVSPGRIGTKTAPCGVTSVLTVIVNVPVVPELTI